MTVEYAADDDPRVTSSAEERVLGSAANSPVVAMMSTLPAEQREVLLLRIIADLPIESVATIMGKTAGAVKQLQRRALLALKSGLSLEPNSVKNGSVA